MEVRSTADGQLLTQLPEDINLVGFSPDEAAELFVVGYIDAPVELHSIPISSGYFSPDWAAELFVVYYDDAPGKVLSTADWELHRLAQLGDRVAEFFFSPGNESLIITHDDGRAYILDLEWLKAMNGRVDELSIDELVTLACEGPLSRGLFDESLLEQYGIDEPQACR